MSERKVVVYGGSGFLGSHVADALSDEGYAVTVYDIAPSPYLRDDQRMVVGDLMDFDQVRSAAEGALAVYNLAAIADLDEARAQPLKVAQVNVQGNMHVLEAARLNGVERMVFASTVYVFSNSGSFYRASKQAAERFIEVYQAEYGLEFTILRYGSLYGRRAGPGNGVYRMLSSALQDHAIRYAGDPDAVREYIHVTDAARMSARILAPEFANRHLVLTGKERLRVRELMQMIVEMMPWPTKIEPVTPYASGHYVLTPYAFRPSIGHKLVLNDFVDLGQGLLDCIHDMAGEQAFADLLHLPDQPGRQDKG